MRPGGPIGSASQWRTARSLAAADQQRSHRETVRAPARTQCGEKEMGGVRRLVHQVVGLVARQRDTRLGVLLGLKADTTVLDEPLGILQAVASPWTATVRKAEFLAELRGKDAGLETSD